MHDQTGTTLRTVVAAAASMKIIQTFNVIPSSVGESVSATIQPSINHKTIIHTRHKASPNRIYKQ